LTRGSGRLRAVLEFRDFRILLAGRLISQFADGLFQAYLVAQLVFLSPEKHGTALGVAKAYAVLVIPFSVIGPLAGVFIDRWSRRLILEWTPLIRMTAALGLLPLSSSNPVLFFPALLVVSINRFYLATASAVIPSLVPDRHLLTANSIGIVGGTVATFAGVVSGTKLIDPLGPRGLLLVLVACWPLASLLATRLSDPLRPARAAGDIRRELSRVGREFWQGARRLVATPQAFGPMVSVSVDQIVIGIVTVLSLVIFKERFKQGVGSYGNILAAGGVGVLVGTVTVTRLGAKVQKPAIVSLAFGISGVAALAVAPAVSGLTILLMSFVLGFTFSWRKVPSDTMVQEAVPDRYRGRVFAVYDLLYSMARVIAAGAAVILIPRISTAWLVALAGLAYLVWTPVLPWWIRRPRWAGVRFYSGSRAEEVPRAIVIAGEEEPVEVLGSWIEDAGGERRRRFRLETSDGRLLEIADDPSGRWKVEREILPEARRR
jgi:MFS family permease